MIWSAAQEYMSQLLRNIIYGKVQGTSGATQQAVPVLVDSTGIVQTHAAVIDGMTVTTILDESWTLTGGGGAVAGSWVDIEGYHLITLVLHNTGGNPFTQHVIYYATGIGGTGLVVTGAATVNTLGAGSLSYCDSFGWATSTFNRNNPWAPIGCRSMRIAINGGAPGTTARAIWMGIKWS